MITAFELAGHFAAHAIWCVSDSEILIPILAYSTADDKKKAERLVGGDDVGASIDFGKKKLEANQMDANDAVLIYDGRIPIDHKEGDKEGDKKGDKKVDAVIIEIRSYFSPQSEAVMAVPYTPITSGKFRVHQAKLIGWKNCEDFDTTTVLQSFNKGVDSHKKGSKVWDESLDDSI